MTRALTTKSSRSRDPSPCWSGEAARRPTRKFSSDAKKPANIEVFLRLGVADPLWRPVPDSALLQQTVLAPTPGTYSPAQAQLERLPSGRSDFGLSLHPDRRTSAGEQDGDSAVQWIVSLLGRAQEVSRPNGFAPLSAQALAQSRSPVGPLARSNACAVVRFAPSPLQPDLSPRFGRPHPLRQTTRGSTGIQSPQEGPPLLPSSVVLRSPRPGVLARFLAGWRHCGQYRSPRAGGPLFAKGAPKH